MGQTVPLQHVLNVLQAEPLGRHGWHAPRTPQTRPGQQTTPGVQGVPPPPQQMPLLQLFPKQQKSETVQLAPVNLQQRFDTQTFDGQQLLGAWQL